MSLIDGLNSSCLTAHADPLNEKKHLLKFRAETNTETRYSMQEEELLIFLQRRDIGCETARADSRNDKNHGKKSEE